MYIYTAAQIAKFSWSITDHVRSIYLYKKAKPERFIVTLTLLLRSICQNLKREKNPISLIEGLVYVNSEHIHHVLHTQDSMLIMFGVYNVLFILVSRLIELKSVPLANQKYVCAICEYCECMWVCVAAISKCFIQ